MKIPTYGSSTHYSGDSGDQYFEWQDAFGEVNGKITARTFVSFVQKDEVILDFGCGGVHLINSLHAKKKVGVEINPAALRSARKFCDEAYSTIEEVASHSIDKVISNHALEHVPYPINALREMYRVLKPGGALILCVPIDDWRNQQTYDPQDINHHLNTWTPQLIGNTLTESGFSSSSIKIKILTHAWIPNYPRYYRFERFFNLACFFYSIKNRRRQLLVIVKK
jgi:SAM-dependent methyltransferase